jgi:peptidyl-tRNA hydrolase, PTH2 family
MKMEYKQVILVRDDLKLPKGKMSAQVSHASVDCVLKSEKRFVHEWKQQGAKKVVLRVPDEKELLKFKSILDDEGIMTALIKDAGHTVVEPGTITCLGAGPDQSDKIDKVTGNLRMV